MDRVPRSGQQREKKIKFIRSVKSLYEGAKTRITIDS